MAAMGRATTTATTTTSMTPFLFVHSTGPTHVHRRDEAVKTEIRRHIMVDIGRARRKTPRNPKIEMVMQQPLSSGADIRSANKNRRRSQQQQQQQLGILSYKKKGQPRASILPAPQNPFWDQHPLVVLERQWEMDMFSAYGIAFVVSEGRNRRSDKYEETAGGSFWFPFAFRASKFLAYFRRTLTSPEMLAAVASAPEKRFDTIALERSIGTVACIEATLADEDSNVATAERVIRGVIASICYNFVSGDLGQAMIHLKGLKQIISARGGIETLQEDTELRLMIFWVDVTASLLFNMKPHFPIPSDLIPSYLPLKVQLDMQALPLQYLLLAAQLTQPNSTPDGYTMIILSCLRDLWAAAESIESRTIRGELHKDLRTDDNQQEDEESIGLLLNPITHRLLSVSPSGGTSAEPLTPPPPSRHRHRHHHRSSIASAIQLGQILWIIAVKRRYRAYPGSSLSSSPSSSPMLVYSKPLLSLLTDERVWAGDAGLLSVRFWLLVLCSISLPSPSPSAIEDERTLIVGAIRDVMRRWELDSWTNVMGYVCQMPWVGSIFEPLVVGLRNEINMS